MRSKSKRFPFVRFLRPSGLFALLAPATALAQPKPAPATPLSARPAATASTASSSATAAWTTVEGRVVGVEDGKFVVDVGARAGATAGLTAELWRPLKLKNPATGRTVEDRYRIGALRITEVLDVMSFAEPEGESRRPPAPGDIIVVRVERPAPATPPPPRGASESAAPAPTPSTDPDAAAVTTLIESLHGKRPEERITEMRAWLGRNARNRFARSIAEEVATLQRLMADRAEQRSVAPIAPRVPVEPELLRFMPPGSGLAGEALEFGVEIGGDVRGAVLHTRHAREVAYASTRMTESGTRYWVATVSAERVQAPVLEYFIEAVRPDGTTVPMVGSPESPLRIPTPDRPTPAPPIAHHSVASIYTDYADYNRLRGNDWLSQTEGFFGMRFQDLGVRAVRTGFGVYRGQGGSIQELDVDGLPPRAVGLTYGYLEGEIGVSRNVSFVGRLSAGLGEDGVTGGGQAHLRIGSDLETNLLVGGEVLGGIGLRGTAQLELSPKGLVPVMIRTEVTNQPAGVAARSLAPNPTTAQAASDVGGRIILQAGYRIVPALVVFGRVSGEGRTINHAGPGFGGGFAFEW